MLHASIQINRLESYINITLENQWNHIYIYICRYIIYHAVLILSRPPTQFHCLHPHCHKWQAFCSQWYLKGQRLLSRCNLRTSSFFFFFFLFFSLRHSTNLFFYFFLWNIFQRYNWMLNKLLRKDVDLSHLIHW